MKVILKFTYDSHLVDIPDKLANNEKQLKAIVRKFDKWLYDKSNDHGLWVIRDNRKTAVCFGGNDFIDWINSRLLKDEDEKAVNLDEDFDGDDTAYVKLYF